MTRIMRDSTSPNDIPLGGTDIAAGYVDGAYEDVPQLTARFPHIPRVLIDVNGSNVRAQVRDWETGDKSGDLATWVGEHNDASGVKDAVVYCNRSTIAEVRQLTDLHILGVDYFLWVATLDGSLYTPSMLHGVVACQDKGSPPLRGYDESVVWPTDPVTWTGGTVNPAPVPVPPAKLPSDWTYPPVRLVSAARGKTSFSVTFDSPTVPAGILLPGIVEYEVAITKGTVLTGPDLLSYPRFPAKAANPQKFEGGSIPRTGKLTVGVRAYLAGHAGKWATVTI